MIYQCIATYHGSKYRDVEAQMYPGRYLETYILFCGAWLLQSRQLIQEV